MSTREFHVYVEGLSGESRWLAAYEATPLRADTPEAIASVFGTYLGGDPPDN
ncbi:hypothetical protein [Kitasatospora sp. NPDC050543]|uniref:hypothetical protein n=1 Tax=Kitasatospora sp. NPDC050543 TaxID=3364054 RepID=UPI0037B35E58